jgi:fumarate reductase subunit D
MTTYHKSAKPLVWLPFAVGGVTAAMILPVLMLITGFLLPLGILPADALSYERIYAFVAHPLGKLALLGVLIPSLWHAAHRFRCTLQDLGIASHGGRQVVMVGCYAFGALFTLLALAVVGSIW